MTPTNVSPRQIQDNADLNLGTHATIVSYTYFGDKTTNGSFRQYISSGALVIEKRVSGAWVEMGRFEA